MIVNLQQMLRNMYYKRLIDYGNTAYQRVSNDWYFENVPLKLRELWYSQNSISFITLSIQYDSEIDNMSQDDLIRRINEENYLISCLEEEFKKLKIRK